MQPIKMFWSMGGLDFLVMHLTVNLTDRLQVQDSIHVSQCRPIFLPRFMKRKKKMLMKIVRCNNGWPNPKGPPSRQWQGILREIRQSENWTHHDPVITTMKTQEITNPEAIGSGSKVAWIRPWNWRWNSACLGQNLQSNLNQELEA